MEKSQSLLELMETVLWLHNYNHIYTYEDKVFVYKSSYHILIKLVL